MLPPDLMLTIKKGLCRLAASRPLWLLVVGCLAGCAPDGPRALLKGERLILDGREAEAVPLLEQAVKLLPANAQAWNHLGLARHGAGQLEAAAEAYQQAVNLDRNLAAAHYNLGCLLLDLNKPAEAVRELNTFTGLQDKSEAGWVKLGYAQLRAAQHVDAERAFTRALQLAPRSAPALNGLGLALVQRGRAPQAMQQFDAALSAQTNYAPALLNQAITAQVHLRDRALALRKYQEYMALPVLQEHRAEAQALANALEAELRPAPVAARSAPARPGTDNDAAPRKETRIVAKPTAEAATPSRRTETPVPRAERPAASPARAPAEVRPAPRAETRSEPAKEAKPEPKIEPKVEPKPETKPAAKPAAKPAGPRYSGPRYTYRAPGVPKGGDRAEAARLLSRGVEMQQNGKSEEALEIYRQAVQADPALFEARFNLGLLSYQEKLPEALPSLEMALAITPGSTRARYVFGLALEQAGYAADAAKELEKVAQDTPADARVHFALGHLYAEKLRDTVAAREHYLKLLELQPQHPQATAIRFWVEQNP